MREKHSMARRVGVLSALSLCSCTVVTGAGDYEVDGELEDRLNDEAALGRVRDLDYDFVAMDFHKDQPLDVAVVDESNVVQARARIILPLGVEGTYPTQNLFLRRGLTQGPQRLFFYADKDFDYQVDGGEGRIDEHIWIESVPPSGVGSFTHNTSFEFFNEDDFTLNADLLLQGPPAGLNDLLRCLAMKLEEEVDETFEVKVTQTSDDRRVGYFRMHAGNTPPPGFELLFKGIVDAGAEYRIESLIDGGDGTVTTVEAPQDGDLVVAAVDWMPEVGVRACLRTP